MTDSPPWTWPWLLATSLSRAALAALVCLGLWGAVPLAIGWHPTTVSSGSMLPRLQVGDVAVSRPLGAAPPAVGSVLLFDDPDHPGRLRLHRFVRIDDDGMLVTRGDANTGDDSTPVALTAVRGIATLRVPWVALPVVWLRERSWLPLGLTVLGLLGLLAVAARSRSFGFPDDEETEDDPGSQVPPPAVGGDAGSSGPDELATPRPPNPARTGGGPTTGSAPVTRRVRQLGVVGVVALLGCVSAAPADAAFTDRTTTSAVLVAATYFKCANAVTAGVPSLWYRMDETSATATAATDSSTYARTGTYSSAGRTAGTSRACVRDTGRAMTFDGSSGSLSSPALSGAAPNTFTIGIWFKTTTTRGGKIIGFGNASSGLSGVYDRHLYLTDTGIVVFGMFPGTVKTLASPTSYNDGGWHQTMATLSSAGMRLYVDGKLLGSDPSVTTGDSINPAYLRIGSDNLNGWPYPISSYSFAGTLDDAVLYPTALTAAQVAAQYEAGTS